MKKLSKVKRKAKNKITHPVEVVERIKDIQYRAKIRLDSGEIHEFSLTEMQQISDMWISFKTQSGFKKL